MNKRIPKIYIVIGPTASGKSEYAVKLAKKINGEIISADSRQVYKGLDIGTGKVTGQWSTHNVDGRTKRVYKYKTISHYCIDFVSAKRQYTVANFKTDATKALKDILKRGKSPIVCGGTGHYVDTLLSTDNIPAVPPNPLLRKKLEKHSTEKLFELLKKKDPARAKNIDPKNKRRLIRALEIIHATGKPVPSVKSFLPPKYFNLKNAQIPIVWTYLNPPKEKLYNKIETRLKERLKEGMIEEVKNLHKKGLPWKRMEDLGLEYRYVSRLLQGKLTEQQMFEQLITEIKHYAKRQQTWFKKYHN